MNSEQTKWEPLAIVAAARTPFAKAYGPLARVPADELGRVVTVAVLQRAGLRSDQVDEVIFGNVSGPAEASNVARVIALRAGVPIERVAHTVNRNCASGMESIISAWHVLRDGRADLVVAGGTESMSNIPLLWDRRMADLLVRSRRARNWWGKLKVWSRLRPGYLKPIPAVQLGLTDPVCGLSMGRTAEVLAREFAISRAAQDQFALESHQKAVATQERCFYSGEIIAVSSGAPGADTLDRDSVPRSGQSLARLGRLEPIFEPRDGTVTAGNSCPLTDGAAAVVLTSATRARQMDCKPLGYVRAYAYAGCDPKRMGLGPVFATNKLLRATGLTLADLDLVEINEAFAAQVLACLKAMNSNRFAQQHLARGIALGELDPERLNIHGGAIALGHPVGTSGTRLVFTLLRALREKGLRRGLATLCVGGGQGAAVLVDTELGTWSNGQ